MYRVSFTEWFFLLNEIYHIIFIYDNEHSCMYMLHISASNKSVLVSFVRTYIVHHKRETRSTKTEVSYITFLIYTDRGKHMYSYNLTEVKMIIEKKKKRSQNLLSLKCIVHFNESNRWVHFFYGFIKMELKQKIG